MTESLKSDGNLGAAIFYLETQARGRGFIERIKQTGANGESIDGAARPEHPGGRSGGR